MKRYGIRPSVCPSMGPQQQTRCCRFATVGPAGRRFDLLLRHAAGKCGQCHVVSVRALSSVQCFGTWAGRRQLQPGR